MQSEGLQIRRALISAHDKSGIVDIARALCAAGAQIIATGKTASTLREAGLEVIPVEKISGSPEAFRGRMKTLSFPVFSGILYRRGDKEDLEDLKRLNVPPIDCVVVNFYPFEKAAARPGISKADLIEEVDIGGPALVRAAAKNSPDVLVLTSPWQYEKVIAELNGAGHVSAATVHECAAQAWEKVASYDFAISAELGFKNKLSLRYGENPHQRAYLEFDPNGPIAWQTPSGEPLTKNELSYNNILDITSAYSLLSDLVKLWPSSTSAVIVKHNNPCGVCVVPSGLTAAQCLAFTTAWDGDPVSAFGGVVVFSAPIEDDTVKQLLDNFLMSRTHH
ncbi:MAG: hypothetical protein AABZ06_11760 [Bdellovibrionota bacterium]